MTIINISGPEVIKLFSCSTQLSTKFILLINVKMPTIVGILTFISMINTTSERFKARNFFICRYFSKYEQLEFCAQLSWAWKKFYNLGARALLPNWTKAWTFCCLWVVGVSRAMDGAQILIQTWDVVSSYVEQSQW